MYQDPFDDICRRIMVIIECFVMLLALSVYYVYTSAKCRIILAYLWARGICIEVYFFLLKKWSHLLIMHVEPWLVSFGLMRQETWTEIEQYRLEVSARYGCEIPRTPDMEEGLRQEGYL